MIGRPKLNDAMLRQACIRSIPARGRVTGVGKVCRMIVGGRLGIRPYALALATIHTGKHTSGLVT
jgi:hypothetical protein